MSFTLYAWHINNFACYHVIAIKCTVSRAENDFMSIVTKVGHVDGKRFQKHALYASIDCGIHLYTAEYRHSAIITQNNLIL